VRLGSGQVVSSVLRVTGVRGFNAIAHGMAVIQQLIYCIARGERKSSLLLHALSLCTRKQKTISGFTKTRSRPRSENTLGGPFLSTMAWQDRHCSLPPTYREHLASTVYAKRDN